MPNYKNIPFKLLSKRTSIINVIFLILTCVESYYLPFALIKWIIIVAKYGGFVELFKYYRNPKPNYFIHNFQYKLELLTIQFSQKNVIIRESHLNIVLAEEMTQVMFKIDFSSGVFTRIINRFF